MPLNKEVHFHRKAHGCCSPRKDVQGGFSQRRLATITPGAMISVECSSGIWFALLSPQLSQLFFTGHFCCQNFPARTLSKSHPPAPAPTVLRGTERVLVHVTEQSSVWAGFRCGLIQRLLSIIWHGDPFLYLGRLHPTFLPPLA